MPKSEKRIEQEIILKASELGCVLFKNNVGVAKLQDGTTIRYGLGNGSSDLIGIAPVKITPNMIGETVGIFLSVEVKKNKKGSYKATEGQKNWLTMVSRRGGFGAVLDDAEKLEEIVCTINHDK